MLFAILLGKIFLVSSKKVFFTLKLRVELSLVCTVYLVLNFRYPHFALTCSFAGAPIGFKEVSMWAVAPKAPSLVVALLAAKARNQTLVYVFTVLGIIELKSWRTGALSPKRSLNAAMTAPSIVQRTIILVYTKERTNTGEAVLLGQQYTEMVILLLARQLNVERLRVLVF